MRTVFLPQRTNYRIRGLILNLAQTTLFDTHSESACIRHQLLAVCLSVHGRLIRLSHLLLVVYFTEADRELRLLHRRCDTTLIPDWACQDSVLIFHCGRCGYNPIVFVALVGCLWLQTENSGVIIPLLLDHRLIFDIFKFFLFLSRLFVHLFIFYLAVLLSADLDTMQGAIFHFRRRLLIILQPLDFSL